MNTLHIKYLDAHILSSEIEYIKKHIPKRYNESITYKSKESQILSLLSGIMIYNNLKIDENNIKYNKLKKPYIENGLFFNVSHSNSIVVFAKSENLIGIDVEFINKKNINILDYAYNEDEKSYINECPGDTQKIERLTELWTIKESLFKASGIETYIEPKNIDTYNVVSKRCIVDFLNQRESIESSNLTKCFKGNTNFLNEMYNVYSFKYLNYYISVSSISKYDNITFEKDEIIKKTTFN